MLFWIVAFLLSVAVASSLAAPLLRGRGDSSAGNEDVAIYRAQLAEVDRDVARGVLDATEAERTKTEIARRLITADKAAAPALNDPPRAASVMVGALAVLVLIAGSIALYAGIGAPGAADMPRSMRLIEGQAARDNRMSQADAIAALGPLATAGRVAAPPEVQQSVDNLRASLAANPDDLEGWQILAAFETRTANLPAAADAMAEVVRIKGDTATVEDLTGLVDLMAYAAQGYVSPEAEAVLNRVAVLDPDNIAMRYYMGLLYDQTDRPDLAFELWRGVIAEGGASLHAELARMAIGDAAYLAGRDYTPPPAPDAAAAPDAAPGPTADDVAAAEEMAPDDRMEMIRGMVAQLNDRLASEGGPPEDWARLISSYGVLGETDAARTIWTEAQTVFAGSDTALALLRAAAVEAGIAE